MRGKRIISLLAAAALIFSVSCTTILSANAVNSKNEWIGTPYWPQFRGTTDSFGITSAKTPVSKNAITEKWSADLKDSWCNPYPIIVGDFIYTVAGPLARDGCTLQKRNTSDGKLVKETPLFEGNGYFPFITYANGKLFVAVFDGRIEAFDAATMQEDWISEPLVNVLGENDAYGLQSLAPVIEENGYLYTGASEGDGSTGAYYCLSAGDDDCVTATDNSTYGGKKAYKMKKIKWAYVPKTGSKGFYWSGGAACNNAVIFGGDNGQLVSHSLTDDKVLDIIDLNTKEFDTQKNPARIRSTVYYDKNISRVFVTARDNATISSIKVNADGTFDHSSLLQTVLDKDGGNVTSSPVVYNGRVYVGGGGMGADTTPFSVLDAATLKIIYQIPIHTQSTPIISIGYADSSNHNTVYIYVAKYTPAAEHGVMGDCIFCIRDFEGNTAPHCEQLITPSLTEYNTATLTVGPDGTLYYKNDSGHLFAFANTAQGTASNNTAGTNKGQNNPETAENTSKIPNPRTGKDNSADISCLVVFAGITAFLLIQKSRRREN